MKAEREDRVTGTAGGGSYRYTVYFEPFGQTLEEARAMARNALRCHLEGLRNDGEAIPPETPPTGQPIREE
jgi:predicted RNase H-like HicB family nuclease